MRSTSGLFLLSFTVRVLVLGLQGVFGGKREQIFIFSKARSCLFLKHGVLKYL